MKVGDLVKYESWHEDLQDRTGLVIEIGSCRFYHRRARVLWSNANQAWAWAWIKELRIVK